jgi:hypothetical protein
LSGTALTTFAGMTAEKHAATSSAALQADLGSAFESAARAAARGERRSRELPELSDTASVERVARWLRKLPATQRAGVTGKAGPVDAWRRA